MNKWIKGKKRFIIDVRKELGKEENLFADKFQILWIFCQYLNINRLTITRLYKYVLKYKFMPINEFEISIRMILAHIDKCCLFKDNSRCKYYLDFYNSIGVRFIKQNKTINIIWY